MEWEREKLLSDLDPTLNPNRSLDRNTFQFWL